jgi:hypothetical protein
VLDRRALSIAEQTRLHALWWQQRILHPKTHKRYQKRRLQRAGSDYSYAPFDQRRTIFVHIPKCAGVSVCRALFGNLAGGHTPLAEYCAVFEPRALQTYFKFTIVRNPWDRVLSAYSFLKKGGMDIADQEWAASELAGYDSFEQFVEQWLTRDSRWRGEHFYPQTYFIDPGRYPIALDFIGHFETLEADFRYIAERMALSTRLDRLNDSGHRNYRDYYSPRTRDIVARVYAEDIQRFGYEY